MLIPSTSPFRPRRRTKARTAPPTPFGLLIVDVFTTGSECVVTFSGPITWDGSTIPANFQAFTSDEDFQSCINVLETGANWIKVEFNASVDAGAAWQLIGSMDGITPAIAWPQNGTVNP